TGGHPVRHELGSACGTRWGKSQRREGDAVKNAGSGVYGLAGTLLREAGGLEDAVHLRLPHWHAGRDVLDQDTLLALGDDRGGQLLLDGRPLGLPAGVRAGRLREARFGLGTHVIHHDTPSLHDFMIPLSGIRHHMTPRSPLGYSVAV